MGNEKNSFSIHRKLRSSDITLKTDLPWITLRNMDFLKDLESWKDIPVNARHLNGIRQAVHLTKNRFPDS